jgi:hypothetical protein
MFPRVLALVIGLFCLMLSAPSYAHDVSIGTRVSKSKLPRGSLSPGQRVIVFGRVGAVDEACKSFVLVELMRRIPGPDRVLQGDATDAEGEYMFLRRPRSDQRLYVRFAGFQQVVAGHDHMCGGSASRQFRLNVRR